MNGRPPRRTTAVAGCLAGALLTAGIAAGPGGCFVQPEELPPRPTGGTTSAGGGGSCGHGACESGGCAGVCAVCGDGACGDGEDLSDCPQDCAVCGDGVCSVTEDVTGCPPDCAACGDGVCSVTEDAAGCPSDCADCTQEPTYSACSSCFAADHPEGAPLYTALVECVYCKACYTICGGWMSEQADCASAPAQKDPCDGMQFDEAACGDGITGCVACALGTPCMAELGACQQSQDCIEFADALNSCPQ